MEEIKDVTYWVYTRVLPAARVAVHDVLLTLPGEKHQGGYLSLLEAGRKNARPPLTTTLIGVVQSWRKRRKYHRLAPEKGVRLNKNLTHSSSFQSRDGEKKWGGAIRAGKYILAFSGLPELADETVVLLVALRIGLLTWDEAVAIAQLSSNDVFLKNTWFVIDGLKSVA